MKTINLFQVVIFLTSSVFAATEVSIYPPITQFEINSVLDSSYQDHRCLVDVLKSHEIPENIRSAVRVNPFFAPQVVPELYFLLLRYFAALDYDNPEKREHAKANFQHALELLETDKQEGSIELWKNAWEDGNPEAYLKLQEIFKEHKRWCQVLSHFPSSESEMIQKINEARNSLNFFYKSVDSAEKLNLKVPHISIAFARFAEAKFISALESPHISVDVENSIRHMLQGVHVHYRKQWTQEKIGDTFGVSQASVSNFLRGTPCPKLVQNVRKYYEDHPDFYFFEPRKKSGWSFNLSSFLWWKSAASEKDESDAKLPLIGALVEKKKG